VRVGDARPPPFILSTITYKIVMYAPAERADSPPPFLTVPLYVNCGGERSKKGVNDYGIRMPGSLTKGFWPCREGGCVTFPLLSIQLNFIWRNQTTIDRYHMAKTSCFFRQKQVFSFSKNFETFMFFAHTLPYEFTFCKSANMTSLEVSLNTKKILAEFDVDFIWWGFQTNLQK